ncbi:MULTISPECIES: hypothetical protein [unclassified Vibrio]|uniref:hypothetical protein n=1 Tax=unclassified Vibrio TaxID=2614977 RepID=UPI001360E74B|nr:MULTISPECIES: hypothetical protein [unclassified Vibrio]NAW57860.1 hypothetical protein [Vibrio sp. V36_P2S2PM302]NAX26557.1 hypothetical protein [Vibrio sp. V38_P2S17PM301]NAX31500.1 hypothetical protein [Vibrio sp. V37_P2S8PM304]
MATITIEIKEDALQLAYVERLGLIGINLSCGVKIEGNKNTEPFATLIANHIGDVYRANLETAVKSASMKIQRDLSNREDANQ